MDQLNVTIGLFALIALLLGARVADDPRIWTVGSLLIADSVLARADSPVFTRWYGRAAGA